MEEYDAWMKGEEWKKSINLQNPWNEYGIKLNYKIVRYQIMKMLWNLAFRWVKLGFYRIINYPIIFDFQFCSN
jgi:hypothetical protein